jgi:glycosyltransferase involved in cell wall biosynthesis
LAPLERPYEVVFVDDGSTDATLAMLRKLARNDARVGAVRLAQNYGQHAALMAGFRHARGAIIVTLDADMQAPPEELPRLLAKLDEGFEVVFGVFRSRHHPLLQRWVSAVGHWLLAWVFRLPAGVRFSPFRGLNRPIVDRMTMCTDTPVQLETLLCRCTKRMGAVTVRHESRYAGESKYTVRRRLRFALHLLRGLGRTMAPRARCASPQTQYVVAECLGCVGGDVAGAPRVEACRAQ